MLSGCDPLDTCAHIFVSIRVCMYVYVCICVYVYVYSYLHGNHSILLEILNYDFI